MKTVTLAGGQEMPLLGLGTWKMFEGSAYAAVKSAIELGYRHIDCAWIYDNEADVGKALHDCFKQKIVSRDDLFITTKLWNDRHRPEHVAAALKEQLVDLQLNYVDMYLIHWPVAHQFGHPRPESGTDFESLVDVPLNDTWNAVIECQNAGLCRNIGVSNFSQSKIDDLTAATGVKPSCLQVESHPYFKQSQLLDYCDKNDIAFVAYCPLGSGDRPEQMKGLNEPKLFDCQALKEIADAHSITTAQVMLSWAVNRGSIPIPKSANAQRQKENLESAQIELNESEMNAIADINVEHRFVDGTFWELEGGPYTAASIWL